MDIYFFTGRDGSTPVKDALDELAANRPKESRATLGKLRLLQKLASYREALDAGYIKHVRGKIVEVKVSGHQVRILGFGWRSGFVAAAVVIKKQDQLDDRDIARAEERRSDWHDRRG